MTTRRKPITRKGIVVSRLVLIVAFILGILLLGGSKSDASAGPSRAQAAVDIPIINICKPTPPVPQSPTSDVPGMILTPPVSPPNATGPADSSKLLETSGMSGMQPFTYDLGCGMDPTSYGKQINAWGDQSGQRWMVDLGQDATALGYAVDKRAWDPSWIASLLSAFTHAAVGVVSARILVPFLGLGLILLTVLLVARSSRGNVRGIANAIAWMMIVLLVGALVVMRPTAPAEMTQKASGAVLAALYGGTDPVTAQTDEVIQQVHYNGWLRRTFGTADSGTAQKYGPGLLAATRVTWAEQAATDPALAKDDADREARLSARKALLKEKSDSFKTIAAQVKSEDPAAYQWLTGEHGASMVALYEMCFAITTVAFRLAVDLLLVLCLILITALGIVWLLASPFLVLPRGERMGRRLLNTTTQAIGYVVAAAMAAWLFSIYTSVVMQPGWGPIWSIMLMIIGSFLFWLTLSPGRKVASLLTAGRVRGNGRVAGHLTNLVKTVGFSALPVAYAFTKGAHVVDQAEKKARDEERAALHGQVMDYHNTVAPIPEFTPSAPLPDGQAVYRREPDGTEFIPDPLPPVAGSVGEVYVRPIDLERKRQERILAELEPDASKSDAKVEEES